MARRFLRLALYVTVPIVLALIAAGIWLLAELNSPYYDSPEAETFVVIPRGASSLVVADILVGKGILRSRSPFLLHLRHKGLERRIQAGEYLFTHPATPPQIAQRLVNGDTYFLSITIPEGLTADETITLLAKNGFGNRDEMKRALLRTEWIADLDPAAQNLEGYLFPETYHFSRNEVSEQIIRTMTEQFRKRISSILEVSPLPEGWNIARIVNLASMIEKEAQVAEERPLVASVLVNRLAVGMTLGCDATIIYGMKLAGIWEGRIGRADLERDSPYNTYIHRGLPPGPICNPGEASIKAALNPAETDYYYYVSRNDGTHLFSKDYASHLRAVNRYQRPPARR
ncbi:MAG TPA: endolytic transglycosylase MltG [Acidobacteriota bacterium]|nr:endolytic transglycosylase MltG [Acidobacteriota bacterium]